MKRTHNITDSKRDTSKPKEEQAVPKSGQLTTQERKDLQANNQSKEKMPKEKKSEKVAPSQNNR